MCWWTTAPVGGCWCLCCFGFGGNCRAGSANSPCLALSPRRLLRWPPHLCGSGYFGRHRSLQFGPDQCYPQFHRQYRRPALSCFKTCLQVFVLRRNRPTWYLWIAWAFSSASLVLRFSFAFPALPLPSLTTPFSLPYRVVVTLQLQHQFLMDLWDCMRNRYPLRRQLHLDRVSAAAWDRRGIDCLLQTWCVC